MQTTSNNSKKLNYVLAAGKSCLCVHRSRANYLVGGQDAGIHYAIPWHIFCLYFVYQFSVDKSTRVNGKNTNKHPWFYVQIQILFCFFFFLQSRSLPRQPSASKNKDRGLPQRQINISISKDVEMLHKAEDAWKPSHKDEKKKDGEDDAETEVVKRNLEKASYRRGGFIQRTSL